MGREIRRVPLDWQHPTDEYGDYIPLEGITYEQAMKDWRKRKRECEADPSCVELYNFPGDTGEILWDEKPTDPSSYFPEWPEGTKLGWCYYENTTEGTPLSPVFKTKNELEIWMLVRDIKRNKSWFNPLKDLL